MRTLPRVTGTPSTRNLPTAETIPDQLVWIVSFLVVAAGKLSVKFGTVLNRISLNISHLVYAHSQLQIFVYHI